MTAIDYRQYAPFFTGFRTLALPGGCRVAVRRYPRPIIEWSVESMVGEYKWQLSANNRHSMAGGSKVRAYRIARMRVASNKSYLNQYYIMFAGPRGFLP